MATDQSNVMELLARFATEAGKEDVALEDATPLYGDGLGLDSLEAAELSVLLEDSFGSDPFSADGQMPATIGDILAFYEVTPAV